MRKGQKAHALVVRHERLHDGVRLAPRHTRGGIVDSLVEAVGAEQVLISQRLQIAAGFPRHHRQRQRTGVGRNHNVISQPALEAEARHAEGPVLVDLVEISGVIAGFGNPQGTARCRPYSI